MSEGELPEAPAPADSDERSWRLVYAVTLIYGALTIVALWLFSMNYEA